MPGSISSFVSRSFSWLSTGGLRPVDPHVEQSTASQQQGAGQAAAAASSAAPLREVVVPLGHLGSLPGAYPAPFAFAGPNVVPHVNEAADAVEQAAAAAALCGFSGVSSHLPLPLPPRGGTGHAPARRSGPASQSTLQSGDFHSTSDGVGSVANANSSSPRRTQTSHLRSLEDALRRHQNHGSAHVEIPTDFPQGPYATIGAHLDRIQAYAENPSVGGGIFQFRQKESRAEGTKFVGPTLRLVCSREGQPPRNRSSGAGSNSEVAAAAAACSGPNRRRSSLRCGCLWSVRLEVVSLPEEVGETEADTAAGYSGYVFHDLPRPPTPSHALPRPPTPSHALSLSHACLTAACCRQVHGCQSEFGS